jgi:ABC-type xylose transport system substrate-binding protein
MNDGMAGGAAALAAQGMLGIDSPVKTATSPLSTVSKGQQTVTVWKNLMTRRRRRQGGGPTRRRQDAS